MSKPKLKWEPSEHIGNMHHAGNYVVYKYECTWYAEFEYHYVTALGKHSTIEAAKAACERHWEEQQ